VIQLAIALGHEEMARSLAIAGAEFDPADMLRVGFIEGGDVEGFARIREWLQGL
jgi:hypothetical protein